MLQKILHLPIDTQGYGFKDKSISHIFITWLVLTVLLAVSLYLTYNLKDKVEIQNEVASINKLQIISPDQNNEMTRSLYYSIMSHVITIEHTILFKSQTAFGSCNPGDDILWSQSLNNYNITLFDDLSGFGLELISTCTCQIEILNCYWNVIFRETSLYPWQNWLRADDDFFIDLKQTSGLGLSTIEIDSKSINLAEVGLVADPLELTAFTVNGIGEPGIEYLSGLLFITLDRDMNEIVKQQYSESIGLVPTINISNNSNGDYLAYFFAIFLGLSGLGIVLIKLLFLEKRVGN